jgi:hypothetical protein
MEGSCWRVFGSGSGVWRRGSSWFVVLSIVFGGTIVGFFADAEIWRLVCFSLLVMSGKAGTQRSGVLFGLSFLRRQKPGGLATLFVLSFLRKQERGDSARLLISSFLRKQEPSDSAGLFDRS